MKLSITTIALVICASAFAQAQQKQPDNVQEVLPDEIQVIGDRSVMQLRIQMMEAEKKVYEVFNKFNDEKRFNIHCSVHKPTGTQFQKQDCRAGFEIEAASVHGRAYYADLHDLLDPFTSPNTSQTVHIPFEFLVASQQQEYKQKLKQVAEENPEFLNAIIEFSEMRQRYESATSTGNKD